MNLDRPSVSHDRPALVRILGGVLLAVLPLAAQAPRDAGPGRGADWTPDDVVRQEAVSSWVLRDDGAQALWVRQRPDTDKDRRVSTLMVMDLPSGSARELTVGQDGVSSPAFSPSGRFVSFVSDRSFPAGRKNLPEDERGGQIWLLDMRGGMARPLTKVPFGVGGYTWIDDETIVLSARERWSVAERREKKAKDSTRVVEDPVRFRERARRLFRFDVATKSMTRLTENVEPIESFAVSPDGRWAVATLGTSPKFRAESDSPPRVELFDLTAPRARGVELWADRRNKPGTFHWRRDSSGFYAVRPHSTVDGETWGAIRVVDEVRVSRSAAPTVVPVDLGWPHGVTGSFVVTPNGFVTGLCNGVRAKFRRYAPGAGEAWIAADLTGDDVAARMHSLVKARNSDRVLVVHGGASDPDHVATARLVGAAIVDAEEVLRPNGGFADKFLARTEVRRWRGANDEDVEGLLYWPKDYVEGQRHPLVLVTHGGPHGVDRDRFSERWANTPNLYAQRGAFVLKTNYHGSSDYGLAFGESIKGRYYELELIDMFSGIRALVEEGLVDVDRLGLVGWSNGAILSIAALTHGDELAPGFDYRFRACAPGAGDVNWLSDYGNCAFGASFDEFYVGGTPWANTQRYIDKSPFFRLDRVTTPTIIFFGSEDTSVPTEQGWEHYRAMSRVGRTPVRYLLFPGAGHGLRKLSHQRRKLVEELRWFDRHLFETEEPVSVVEDDSPLDVARRRVASIATVGANFGVAAGDAATIVPEVVPLGSAHAGVHVGRFEVTRAQWRAFRPEDPNAVGDGNRPMTGIDADAAAAYVAWLSRTTGETWRLPTAAEFGTLGKAVGSAENDLKWWAGYAPAPADALALQRELVALGVESVLMPVGSRPPGHLGAKPARAMVFDAGGNAAEWVQGDDRPIVAGSSAVWSDDGRSGASAAARTPAAFVGLRVVRVDS